MINRLKIGIQGTVQGIGFRPFVFNLAKENNLYGYVANTSNGVDIEVQGESNRIDRFFKSISKNPPPLAQIADIVKTPLPARQEQAFSIRKSETQAEKTALLPPDVGICEDCLYEMRDPSNRRYGYPFTNCTNCGPRFTITDDLPYDRSKTTMQSFIMCDECLSEYHDPTDRRFHAQPNACPVCGPHMSLYDNSGSRLTINDPIGASVEQLRKGAVIAIKGLGGFHLAVDAENTAAINRLRQGKHREDKPLALMSYDLDRIRCYARVDEDDAFLLTSPARPIVLLQKRLPNSISGSVSPGLHTFAVMLPYTPLHYLLLDGDLLALVMTSGNMSGEPIVADNADALDRLDGIADYLLLHDRDIRMRADDSIVRRVGGLSRLLRRSRGYVPAPVFLKRSFPHILACGAETSNTVCLTKGKHAFISQHIGDLKNLESIRLFENAIAHIKRLFDIRPQIVACDLHPDYLSSQYAKGLKGVRLMGVQHHHAHIASCMAENDIEGPVIGLAFDGTGFGIDGRIWGGEVLLAHSASFQRLAHLEYIPMPGGASAIKEPWRMAVSYLYHTFGNSIDAIDLPMLSAIETQRIQTTLEMIKKGVNCPQTSSIGRLFDGISALIGIRYRSSYEGQAAVELESSIVGKNEKPFPYEFHKIGGIYQIDLVTIIRGVVAAIQNNTDPGIISSRFHRTLICLFTDLCDTLRQETGIEKAVLSGGVFQNMVLLTQLETALTDCGMRVYTHKNVPCNDGGISLGQAAVAAARDRLGED